MDWLSLRDTSSLLCFYYTGLWKYPVMWILPKFSVSAVCTDQNSTYKFYLIPKGRTFPRDIFLFNRKDLGEWERWEREAEIILTTRNVLFFWNQMSHNAVCYYLHVEDSLSPSTKMDKWISLQSCGHQSHKWSPRVVFSMSFFSPIRFKCYDTLFNVYKLLLIISVNCIQIQ